MKNKYFLFNFLINLLFVKCFAINANAPKRPHVVLIVADDLGWGDVSLHGSQQVLTPNIDVLATNGIVLNNYYVSPICSPSRSALMSGLHPIHTGLQHGVIRASQPFGLPLKYKILPQYLKELDYETHAVGKWHLGYFKRKYIPTRRGFDTHFGYWNGHEDYYDRTCAEKQWWGIDFRDGERPVPLSQYAGNYSTHIYTKKSMNIILNERNVSKPLFLYLAHQSVHAANGKDPLQVPDEYVRQFKHIKNEKRRQFVAMVSALDESVGDVVFALQKANILNETIIIFTTDNGGATGGLSGASIDNSMGSNWPLRGAKYTLFEGGIRGFAFVWSTLLKRKYISEHLMHIKDWLPTIYSAVGGNTRDLKANDGIDMWDVLKHDTTGPQKRLLHNIDQKPNVWALRDGDYKLIFGTIFRGDFDGWFLPPGEEVAKKQTALSVDYKRCKVYKVLHGMDYEYKDVERVVVECNASRVSDCAPTVKPCLFNIRSDPCEYNNVYKLYPNVVKSMRLRLDKYNASAVAPINQPRDEMANPVRHSYWWDIWR